MTTATATKKRTLDGTTVTEHFWRTVPQELRSAIIGAYGTKTDVIGAGADEVYATLKNTRGGSRIAASFKRLVITGSI